MRRYKVVLAEDARQQVATIQAWWKANRPSNPRLFRQELQAAVDRLSVFPNAGAPYGASPIEGVRRLLLPRTQHYLYYRVDAGKATVHVVAVWHLARGKGPAL